MKLDQGYQTVKSLSTERQNKWTSEWKSINKQNHKSSAAGGGVLVKAICVIILYSANSAEL